MGLHVLWKVDYKFLLQIENEKVKIKFLALFLLEENMIKKVLKKLEKLKLEKSNLVTEQTKIQEKIDNIDIKIKEYNTIKKDYEKLEQKYNNISNTTPKKEKQNE